MDFSDGAWVTLQYLISQDRAEIAEFFERVPKEDRAFLKKDLINRHEVGVWMNEIDVDRETVIVGISGT